MQDLSYSYMRLLEHETSLTYGLLVKKCNDFRTKLLLVSVHEDTKKHANIMRFLCRSLGQAYPPPIARCEVDMGQAYKESLDHVQSVRDALQNGMTLLEAVKTILQDEKAISEEYVILLHSKVRLIDEEDNAIKRILGDIAADEERHQQLLQLVMESISR